MIKIDATMGNGVQGQSASAPADALQFPGKTVTEQRCERVWKWHETRPLDPAKIRTHRNMNLVLIRRGRRRRRSTNTDMSNRGIAQKGAQNSCTANGATNSKWLGKYDSIQ